MDQNKNNDYYKLEDSVTMTHPFDSSVCEEKSNKPLTNPTQNINNNQINNQTNSNSQYLPKNTLTCGFINCKVLLGYPDGAHLVICPNCKFSNQVISYLKCGVCSAILGFPAGSQYVQCPCKSINSNPYFRNYPV